MYWFHSSGGIIATNILAIIFIAFVIGSWFIALNKKNTSISYVQEINREILSLPNIEGKYVLHIFSSWCEKCHITHDFFIKSKINIPIYGLIINDNPKNISKFFDKYHNPYKEIFYDNDSHLLVELGVRGIPEILIIENKVVKYKVVGAPNLSMFL